MDKTTKSFIEKAIEQLEHATYQYGVIPQGTIIKVEQIIGELEYLIEG